MGTEGVFLLPSVAAPPDMSAPVPRGEVSIPACKKGKRQKKIDPTLSKHAHGALRIGDSKNTTRARALNIPPGSR